MSTATGKTPRLTTSAMIASIAAEGQRVKAAPFGKALVELAGQRSEIVGMTADLAKYTDLHLFAQAYPDRFFQMGMAEQLLMGAAFTRCPSEAIEAIIAEVVSFGFLPATALMPELLGVASRPGPAAPAATRADRRG